MPLLARAKRRVGNKLYSSTAVKDVSQTSLCAYLSVALLIGRGANALLGWWWADPLAALAIAAVAAKEGRESWRGEGCLDGCCQPTRTPSQLAPAGLDERRAALNRFRRQHLAALDEERRHNLRPRTMPPWRSS
jgi:hypothetical protein